MTRVLGCGYYMGEEKAFARLYDPIHHWVDRVRLFELTGDSFEGVGTGPLFGRRSGDGSGRSPSLEPLSLVGTPERPAPELTTIDGGAPRRLIRDDDDRERGHLRLVKSDAG